MKMFLPFITLLIFSGFVCNKKVDGCLKAKVLRVSCASFVVQVLNQDSIGSYGWKDISGNGVYNNVFRVSNPCKIGMWAKGEEFYFKINDTLKAQDCVACMMYDAPPEKSYMISAVSAKGCN
ncbi:MAG: hypothetical protein ABI151_08725 [Chitinophagaceae bacterium]